MNKEIEQLIGEKIKSQQPLSGGCIGTSYKLQTTSEKLFFLKQYKKRGMTQAEAFGLQELQESGAVRVPKVFTHTDKYLILEYIESAPKVRNFQPLMGQQFAKLHKVKKGFFGLSEDNFLGESDQKNNKSNNWCNFFTENRLDFQISLAKRQGLADKSLLTTYQTLKEIIPQILVGSEEEPSLLHGDLWGGNYMVSELGEPVFIDPAIYYGHREADLAMTSLFGGFDSSFYDAYQKEYPLKEGWQKRQDLYKLYHILNHLNLFGQSYYSQALSLMHSYV